jgi:hypothetical protein
MTQKATEQLGPDNLQTLMDEAERAYDGGLIREGRYLGGELKDDEEELGQGSSTDDDIRKLEQKYPDLYDTVETVAHLRSAEQVSQLQDQLQSIQQREVDILRREAEAALMTRHPDFEDIRGSDKFHEWAKSQPEAIQEWIYNNSSNAELASKAIDLFKMEHGLQTQIKSQPKTQGSAADIVSTKTTTVDTKQPKIWTEREIDAMSLDQFDKYEDEIQQAITEGRVIKN